MTERIVGGARLRSLLVAEAAGTEPTEPELSRSTVSLAVVGSARRERATIDGLDLSFFGISAAVAAAMSPRARARLEVAWEALEDAGVTTFGPGVGLFVADADDEVPEGPRAADLAAELAIAGPVMVVSAGAGSSLLPVHLASQALRDGDADVAVAIAPLGPKGDDGVGAVVLRTVKDAVRSHDRITRVVTASGAAAAGSDEPDLKRRVRRRGGLGLGDLTRDVRVPGLAGLLTALSDAGSGAVATVTGRGRDTIVHLLLEAPDNAVAWAKAEVEREPQPGFEPVTARPPAGTPIPGPLRKTPAPRQRSPSGTPAPAPRNAGPSYGAPASLPPGPTPAGPQTIPPSTRLESDAHVLVMSARSAAALEARSDQVEALLGAGAPLTGLAATLAARRVHFEHRLAIPAWARDGAEPGRGTLHSGVVEPGVDTPVAFLFTGEGTHRPNMAAELYDTEPVFRDTLNRCDALLRYHMERPLLSVLFPRGDHDDLRRVALSQPALFAVQFALTELWRFWGVVPGAVLGYGLGEYVAATVAGVLRLEDAIALVAARARLLTEEVRTGGAMAVVRASERRIRPALDRRASKVAVAAINTPSELVISGHADEVEELLRELEAMDVEVRRLEVELGFHSPHVDPALEAFEHVARLPAMGLPRLTMVSSLTGEIVGTQVASASHWCAHLRGPVRFAQGVHTLLEAGYRTMVEIGPKPVLARMVRELAGDAPRVLPSMRVEENDHQVMLDALAALWTAGCRVDPAARYGRIEPVALPPYPWQREDLGAADRRAAGTTTPAAPKVPAALANLTVQPVSPPVTPAPAPGRLEPVVVAPDEPAPVEQAVVTPEDPETAVEDEATVEIPTAQVAAAAEPEAAEPETAEPEPETAEPEPEAAEPERELVAAEPEAAEAEPEPEVVEQAPVEEVVEAAPVEEASAAEIVEEAPAAEAVEEAPAAEAVEEAPVEEVAELVDELPTITFRVSEIEAAARAARETDPWAACSDEDALHQLVWRELEPAARTEVDAGLWIVLSDAEGLGDYVAAGLEGAGHTCVRVRPEPAFGRSDGTVYVADPGSAEDWAPLAARLAGASGVVRVLHLWSFDLPEEGAPQEILEKAGVLGLTTLVRVRGMLEELNLQGVFWAVTRGAVALGDATPGLGGALLWGASAALPGGWIDLDPMDEDADALVDNVLASDGEARIALRDGQRFALRAEHVEAGGEEPRLALDRTFLVVAPAPIALELARWLVDRGARRIVLAPESRPAGDQVQQIMALQQTGARVSVVPVQVARAADLDRLFKRLKHEPPVGGVFLAPPLDDSSDGEVDPHAAVAPWIRAAWSVHERLEDAPLQWFVSLLPHDVVAGGSLVDGVRGAVGLELARHRHRQGARGRAVLWQSWSKTTVERRAGLLRAALRTDGVELALLAPTEEGRAAQASASEGTAARG